MYKIIYINSLRVTSCVYVIMQHSLSNISKNIMSDNDMLLLYPKFIKYCNQKNCTTLFSGNLCILLNYQRIFINYSLSKSVQTLHTSIRTFILSVSAHPTQLNKDRPTDVTCFIISIFNAQHVSDVSTSIFRSLRLIC